MLNKIYLVPNENKLAAILKWDEAEEDYIFEQFPDNLTRMELFELSEEVAYLTKIDQ